MKLPGVLRIVSNGSGLDTRIEDGKGNDLTSQLPLTALTWSVKPNDHAWCRAQLEVITMPADLQGLARYVMIDPAQLKIGNSGVRQIEMIRFADGTEWHAPIYEHLNGEVA